MSGNKKKLQYEEQIKNEVNQLLRRGLDNSAFTFCSITKVEISPDFSTAKLFWDTFDPAKRGDIAKAMDASLGKIRSHLAKTLQVRHTPSLTAEYDSQFEDEQEIEKLLQSEKDKGKSF
ncbi:30S ribosome-binding factor RbfA [Halobacteriovorax sp. GFR7]|uniref:30S ribosome-binding factor RbfA n=1 Tax=unclassified Halobacteriovorax TaxID=2639665 RepID=UPI0037153C14